MKRAPLTERHRKMRTSVWPQLLFRAVTLCQVNSGRAQPVPPFKVQLVNVKWIPPPRPTVDTRSAHRFYKNSKKSHFSIFLFSFICAIFRVAALIWLIAANLCRTLWNNTTEPFVSNLIYNIFLDILCTQFYFYDIRLSHWRLSHRFRSPAGEVTVALWSVLLVSELVHSGLITFGLDVGVPENYLCKMKKKKENEKKNGSDQPGLRLNKHAGTLA